MQVEHSVFCKHLATKEARSAREEVLYPRPLLTDYQQVLESYFSE
jgi:hypothetical protein